MRFTCTLRIFGLALAALAAGPLFVAHPDGTRAMAQTPSAYERASEKSAAQPQKSADQGPNISAKYLKQARAYRDQGRYELARQSYAQALSTCRSAAELEVIEREMGGIELLLRTMR
ncbi:hypothetical protein [Desulfovibrio sp.]|uniref:hypothetical protein n=1 Tax=Desulfovibrio sp. TaxID=885 RepID=UPI0025BA079F|nr:hypothetical protein [Desulfovibrio sp.]